MADFLAPSLSTEILSYAFIKIDDLPIDGRGSSMTGKDGWMVNNGAMLWIVNNIHGNKLWAERKDIQLCSNWFIGIKNFLNRLPLHSPPWELKYWGSIFFCSWCWKIRNIECLQVGCWLTIDLKCQEKSWPRWIVWQWIGHTIHEYTVGTWC